MNSTKCERCDRPAKFHETVVENGAVIERHLCARHGQQTWFDACRDPLVDAVASLPDGQLPPGVNRAELQTRLSAAKTLAEARSVFQRKP
ncbi:MAG TPA: hypothetical protein VM165_07040 [Planctomycetaceae bacterium]|nr:hypothetical protein [Planctomycetaceae bacterium]